MTNQRTFNSWVTCPRPNPQALLRLFCFPYAGGGASVFRTWSNNLPAEVEVCPIQLPGRENRLLEPPFTRLAPLVGVLAHVLLPYLNLPFVFFGHSMGALISFELARHLRNQQGPSPLHLFVSACRAPQIPTPNLAIHDLPEPAFIEAIRDFNGTPEPVLQSAELMQLLLPVLRADFAVCETYVYSDEEPLACAISAFGGLQDCEVSHDELAAWRDQTDGFFMLRMLPGNHFFLRSAQASLLGDITQELTGLLARSLEKVIDKKSSYSSYSE